MKQENKKKCGKYVAHNVKLEVHEHETISFFLNLGEEIEQVVPSNAPHVRRPDFWMRQLLWEAKSPTVSRERAVGELFYSALGQSENVIFDLRRLKSDDKNAVKILCKLFAETRRIRRLLIITKNGRLVELKK